MPTPNKINEKFLALAESRAKDVIARGNFTSILECSEIVSWVCYTRHLSETVIELLAEKNKAEKDLKETQYLSVLWIKALTSVMPPEMQRRAMKVAGQVITRGMREAGMESYDANCGQLEQPLNPE